MNSIAACPSFKAGIKKTLLNSCVSILKKIHSVQNMLQRYSVPILVLLQIAGKPHFLENGVTQHVFFSPLLLSFLICTRNLISISFHPAGQCYLLFYFLPIIDLTPQNRLQLPGELFFPLGTEKTFMKRKGLVSLSTSPFSVEIQVRPSWKLQALLVVLYFQLMC